MSAFKVLDSSNVVLTDYVARKHWSVSKDGTYGADGSFASNGITVEILNSSDDKYKLLDQCFYASKFQESTASVDAGLNDSRFDLELQSTITIPAQRKLPDEILLITIPKSCFGTQIEHRSVSINVNGIPFEDREGIIYGRGYGSKLGSVIYNKGLIILDREEAGYSEGDYLTLSFTSNVPIFTYNVNCYARDYEFNYTLNPTAKNLSNFAPYVTSVGLYNKAGELMAVAKLSKPIKKASNIDTTFKISIDIS